MKVRRGKIVLGAGRSPVRCIVADLGQARYWAVAWERGPVLLWWPRQEGPLWAIQVGLPLSWGWRRRVGDGLRWDFGVLALTVETKP